MLLVGEPGEQSAQMDVLSKKLLSKDGANDQALLCQVFLPSQLAREISSEGNPFAGKNCEPKNPF